MIKFVRFVFVMLACCCVSLVFAQGSARSSCGEGARLYEEGRASWYGSDFQGSKTASGERYDMYDFTIAHKTLIKLVSAARPVWVCIKNKLNGKSVMARVNDAGPYVGDRIADLSYAAAKEIGLVNKIGVADVELYVYN